MFVVCVYRLLVSGCIACVWVLFVVWLIIVPFCWFDCLRVFSCDLGLVWLFLIMLLWLFLYVVWVMCAILLVYLVGWCDYLLHGLLDCLVDYLVADGFV